MCRSTFDFTRKPKDVRRRQTESRVCRNNTLRMEEDFSIHTRFALDLPAHILTLQRKIRASCHNLFASYQTTCERDGAVLCDVFRKSSRVTLSCFGR
jgi:hypothetical protein